MLGQVAIQLIPVLLTGLLAFLVYILGTCLTFCGSGALGELSWMLPNAPALNEFILFVLQSAFSVIAVSAGTLFQVSNHIILSLDILYFLSLCMLFLYHRLKEAGNLYFEILA